MRQTVFGPCACVRCKSKIHYELLLILLYANLTHVHAYTGIIKYLIRELIHDRPSSPSTKQTI